MQKNTFGVWEITLLNQNSNEYLIKHNTFVKISMVVPDSPERIERIPAYIKRATQDLSVSPVYQGSSNTFIDY